MYNHDDYMILIGWGGAIVDRGIFWTKWGNFGQSKYLEIHVLIKVVNFINCKVNFSSNS